MIAWSFILWGGRIIDNITYKCNSNRTTLNWVYEKGWLQLVVFRPRRILHFPPLIRNIVFYSPCLESSVYHAFYGMRKSIIANAGNTELELKVGCSLGMTALLYYWSPIKEDYNICIMMRIYLSLHALIRWGWFRLLAPQSRQYAILSGLKILISYYKPQRTCQSRA